MNNTGIIDRFLETFTAYIDSGFGLLGGEVAFLTSTLIVIDIVLAGLFWAWGADEDVLQRLVKKTLYIGFFAFIIGNFNGSPESSSRAFPGSVSKPVAPVCRPPNCCSPAASRRSALMPATPSLRPPAS